jgi:F-type H+-transporting ATPase subunit a
MDGISITPDVVFFIAGFIPVTSAHISLFVITMTLALISVYFYRTASLVPTSLQVVMEGIYDWFMEKVMAAFPDEKSANRVLPLIMTFFLVIIFANLFGLLPIINSLVVHVASGQDISLFATPTSHLSMTLAFTLITLVITHVTALRMRPLKYIGNFIQIGSIVKARSAGALAQAILDFLLGLLDIVGEIAKLISLSCRLFGNVLAGELMVIVIMSLAVATQFFVPLPFIILALISGIIQAIVFSLLSLNYISLAVSSVED